MTFGGIEMDDLTLKSLLLHTQDLAHRTEGWIQPLIPILDGVDAETAAWKPAPDAKSVWEVVAHQTQYLESVVADISGGKGPEIDDWPTIVDTSEDAWQQLLGRLRAASNDLAPVIERLSEENLRVPPTGMETPRCLRVIDVLIHDAYHAGQIYQLLGLRQLMVKQEAAVLA
jgi:hypothetical protein